MTSRRDFINRTGVAAFATASGALFNALSARDAVAQANDLRGPEAEDDVFAAAADERFWANIATAFTVDRSLINLNNGGVSPSPSFVQDAMQQHLDFSNKAPTYTMWQVLEPQREGVRQQLARQFACDAEEIALTRNASESLQICQMGIDLRDGDEILTSSQDYPRMLTTFRQRVRREGLELTTIDLPVVSSDDDEIVQRFAEAITDRTRLMLISHMIFLTGQVLPVQRLARLGREHNIPVIVDGAHSFAHFPFTAETLDCDYFGTSLHKWLFAPHGTGMLYVKRDRIPGLWPLTAANENMEDDIRKFEEIGTHPAANYLAVSEALTFNQGIGFERKARRLVYLRDRWAKRLREHDRVVLHTSLEEGRAYALATVEIQGIDPRELTDWLWHKHRTIVTPINHPQFQGIRVSPSVYTTPQEIDRFADVMETVVRRGLSA